MAHWEAGRRVPMLSLVQETTTAGVWLWILSVGRQVELPALWAVGIFGALHLTVLALVAARQLRGVPTGSTVNDDRERRLLLCVLLALSGLPLLLDGPTWMAVLALVVVLGLAGAAPMILLPDRGAADRRVWVGCAWMAVLTFDVLLAVGILGELTRGLAVLLLWAAACALLTYPVATWVIVRWSSDPPSSWTMLAVVLALTVSLVQLGLVVRGEEAVAPTWVVLAATAGVIGVLVAKLCADLWHGRRPG